jgi:hypothetical protein
MSLGCVWMMRPGAGGMVLEREDCERASGSLAPLRAKRFDRGSYRVWSKDQLQLSPDAVAVRA